MRYAIALWIVVLLGSAGLAHADRKDALKYFRAGEKAYRAQKFQAAAENFHAAFKELPLPEIAFSAAQAYRRQFRADPRRDYVKNAVTLYEFYLSKVKTGGRVKDAGDALMEMRPELAKLGNEPVAAPVEKPRTQLAISVNLIGVMQETSMKEIDDSKASETAIAIKTLLDGKVVEPESYHDVEPGPHVVRAEAPGFAPFEKRITAHLGYPNLADLNLQPLPARVTIRTEEGARISIDGDGVTAGETKELPAGTHVLRIVRTGRHPIVRSFEAARGQELTIAPELESTTRRKTVKFVAGAAIGFGVVAALTGISAAVEDGKASDRYAELQVGGQDPALLTRYTDAREMRDMLVTGTYLFGATAVGIGLTAGFLYYFDTPSSEGLRIEPMASPGVGGAQVIGRF